MNTNHIWKFFLFCLFFFSFYIFICNDGNGVLGISRILKLRNPHLKVLHFWGFRLVLSILAMLVAGFFGHLIDPSSMKICILVTSFLLFLCCRHSNKKSLPLYIVLLFFVYIEISMIRYHILPGVGRGMAAVLVLCIGEGLVPSNPSSYIENAPSSSSVNQPRAAEHVDLEPLELTHYPLALQQITVSLKELCFDPALREHFPLLDFDPLHYCPIVLSMLHSDPFYIRTLQELDEITDKFHHGSSRDDKELKQHILDFLMRRFPDYYVERGTELHRSDTYFPDQ